MARRVGAELGWVIAVCLGASACSEGSGGGDWSLRLIPQTHPNQLPFDGGPTAKLLLRRATGDEVIDLGTPASGGDLQATELPSSEAMGDVEVMGLAIEESGGAPGTLDLERLNSYGEAPVEALSGELPVLLSQLDRIGDLGLLGEAKQRFLRVAGIVPPGKVYLLTGALDLGSQPSGTTPVTADIFELQSLDGGEPWVFNNIGTLTGTSNPPARLAAAASSVVGPGDAPMILVTGGRDFFWLVNSGFDDWFLWDPATLSIAKKGKLDTGRSEHFHVLMANGSVLVAGGWSDDSINSADLIDPAAGTVQEVELDLPGVSGCNGASLGSRGALVCGGFDLSGPASNTVAEAVADCVIINFQGVSSPAAPLPFPLAKFAMASIGEGKVLVAGGITWNLTQGANDPFDAVGDAFIYDAETDDWSPAANLNDPRSAAVGIPLANGRVLVAGGTASDGVFLLPDGEVVCPEVYDPADDTFTSLEDQCGSWGAGASPPVAQWPGLGTVLMKGYTVDEEPQDAVGFIGDAPVTQ